jgi:hypothetical protein
MAGNGFEISFYNDETGQWEVTPAPSAKPLAVRKKKAAQAKEPSAGDYLNTLGDVLFVNPRNSAAATLGGAAYDYAVKSTPRSVVRDITESAEDAGDWLRKEGKLIRAAPVTESLRLLKAGFIDPLADPYRVFKQAATERARGNEVGGKKLAAMVPLAVAGVLPQLGGASKAATKAGVEAAETAAMKAATKTAKKTATKKTATKTATKGATKTATVSPPAKSPAPSAKPSLSVKTVPPERGSTAYGTYELAPGVMTRHRQDVLGDEALRNQFSLDPATSWQTSEGTDTLYDALGLPQSETVRMTGIYTPNVPGAVEESNIGFAARPRLRTDLSGDPIPEDYNAMSAAEAVRAVADTQGAGAWSMPTLPSDPAREGAIFVPTGSPTDIERLLELRERGAKYGLPDIGDLGEGVMLTNFEKLPLGSDTKRALSELGLGRDLRQLLGANARPQTVGTTGDYIGLEKAWMQPEGSGAVSETLRGYLDNLTPQYREAMLEDPRVARQFGQRFLRDEQARMAGVPVRDDVQRAREAIAEQERLQALFDLIARGRPAMAQGGLASADE